jgi:hypothetical protein
VAQELRSGRLKPRRPAATARKTRPSGPLSPLGPIHPRQIGFDPTPA